MLGLEALVLIEKLAVWPDKHEDQVSVGATLGIAADTGKASRTVHIVASLLA